MHNSDVIHVSLLRSFPAISVFDKESVVNKVFHALPSLKTTLHTPYLQRCNVLRHSEPKDLENLDLITLH